MRQSEKARCWSSIPAYNVGCCSEAVTAAKGAEDYKELQVLKGNSRSLLPRT
ncbi:hypothetical protein JI735_01430 [Paenibacillus sonchi]|uniref:Uncharacterized protein n=1 Tax=Paenibacillus sonchi TaxID=373687 RepID=A0A974PDL6_9BACL|nr:hypothetical protein [Paenibacillus sonchi]QQZ61478.1 hypothetical protein JI735_01430 [Paenibacillus sonchi]